MPIIGEIRTFAFVGGNSFKTLLSDGWLPCFGGTFLRDDYEDLHRTIGEVWGAEDHSTKFNVPDLRGSFLRGVSLKEIDTDPDAAERSHPRPLLANKGQRGPLVGSKQESAFKEHKHTAYGKRSSGDAADNQLALTRVGSGASDSIVDMTNTGESSKETRPFNHNVLFMIFAGTSNEGDVNGIANHYENLVTQLRNQYA